MATKELSQDVGVRQACAALGVARATFYRQRDGQAQFKPEPPRQARSPRALSRAERDAVRSLLHSQRFCDRAPREVYATELDAGRFHCSVRTMYRILQQDQSSRKRRNQLRHPHYQKPELLARRPNQVWSWDITKLLGPQKWTYYYLYVILDIFSRYVVGWLLAHRESADLARRLIRETVVKQGVVEEQLTIHSDRGPSMTSHGVAQLLASLGVTKSHSRPQVSNDNPFSESQFKTMKYWPEFPSRFDGFEHAHRFLQAILLVVQRRALSQRDRPGDAGNVALRRGGTGARGASASTECSVRGASGALRAGPAIAAGTADGGLDQPTVAHERTSRSARKKASGGALPAEARHALGAPWARLSLVELRPRRAQLRFTGRARRYCSDCAAATPLGHPCHA